MGESSNVADPRAGDVVMQWGVLIPLRDDVHLSAIVYLPRTRNGAIPVLVTLTPYISQAYHDQGVYFAARGYAFATVDVRGRGNSEGVFRPLINEAQDAFDVVEWLAQQSYCNGQVAMWGGSYAGYVQWAAASQLPPHLVSVVPVASPYLGVDFPIRGNIGAPYCMQWLWLVSGRTSQEKIFADTCYWRGKFREWFEAGVPFKELDSFLGNPSTIFQEWIAHPQQDRYWDSYNLTSEQMARIRLPVLTITGIFDVDQLGALMNYTEHLRNAPPAVREQHYLVIGPWDHAGTRSPAPLCCGLEIGTAGLLDLPKLHLEWYDWVMRGGPRPAFLRNSVAYYVIDANEWRYADSLDAVTERSVEYFLRPPSTQMEMFESGLLTTAGPIQARPACYIYDPRDVGHAILESTIDPESRVDDRMMCAFAGRQLVYDTAPFEKDVEVSGFFELSAWLAIDQLDTDFRASVHEVGGDGSVVQLTIDLLRARYREDLRAARLIRTTEPLLYRFSRFMFVSKLVRAGSCLRLLLGPVNSIYNQKNYNSGGVIAEESMQDARSVRVTLFHDQARPSVLRVPFGRR